MNTYFKIFVIALCFIACDKDDILLTPLELPDSSKLAGVEPAELGEKIEAFGLDLFRETYQQSDKENICISPLSVSTAVSMALNGAAAQTKTDILSTLHFQNLSLDSINSGFQLLNENMEPVEDKVRIHSVNAAFWDENRVQPYDDFLNALSFGFDTQTKKLDFNQVEASKDHMNAWVENNTENKIKDLIKKIKECDVMFLLNALYFKGDWENPFSEGSTRDKAFHKEDGTTVNVPFMKHDSKFKYYIGDDYSAVDLPFVGLDYSMTFLLPPNSSSPGSFVEELDPQMIEALYADKLQIGRVYLGIPRFEIKFEIELKEVLSALGMEIAFNNDADFTDLGEAFACNRRMYISRVNHKTKLIVDEKGVEGAAATAVVISTYSLPPSIVFNRPFIYLIRHTETQTILFIGVVGDPLT